MGQKQRTNVAQQIANIPEGEDRIILASGCGIWEKDLMTLGLKTLLLTFPVSWRVILIQYAGRLHKHATINIYKISA